MSVDVTCVIIIERLMKRWFSCQVCSRDAMLIHYSLPLPSLKEEMSWSRSVMLIHYSFLLPSLKEEMSCSRDVMLIRYSLPLPSLKEEMTPLNTRDSTAFKAGLQFTSGFSSVVKVYCWCPRSRRIPWYVCTAQQYLIVLHSIIFVLEAWLYFLWSLRVYRRVKSRCVELYDVRHLRHRVGTPSVSCSSDGCGHTFWTQVTSDTTERYVCMEFWNKK